MSDCQAAAQPREGSVWRKLICVLLGAFLLGIVWPSRQVSSQQAAVEQQQNAAELVRLYDRWKETQDAEDKIKLGEQVLTLEPVLKDWPLLAAREHIKGELWFELGYAYVNRIAGDRADNLEKAITAYEMALPSFILNAMVGEWATTQNNLANAFWNRIRGDRADNLEKTIAAYETSLRVFTRETFPHEWADTQNNVGIAYRDRIRGDRADNLEKAIAAFEAALTVRTREALPREWAYTQNHLAGAYRSRIRGDQADNLEKAIGAYEATLDGVHARRPSARMGAHAEQPRDRLRGAHPRRSGRQPGEGDCGLRGGAHCHSHAKFCRATGQIRRTISPTPIATASAAIEPTTWRKRLPPSRRRSQCSLAKLSRATGRNTAEQPRQRLRGARPRRSSRQPGKGIAAYEAALLVFTREALPREWARTQNNLASVYQHRIRGDRGRQSGESDCRLRGGADGVYA